jgi:HTH-type transcriptional regulator/antitoxin MqsA
MDKFCLQCDDGTALTQKIKDIPLNVRGESCVVPNVAGWHCPVCGDIQYENREDAARVWQAIDMLSAKAKARDSAVLVKTRKRLKLTQKQAAELTGGGHNAFSRYERGEVVPMRAVINLFKLLNNHPELLKELA